MHVGHVRVRSRDEVAFTWHDQKLTGSSGEVRPSDIRALVTQDVAEMIPARMENLKLRSTIPLVVEIPSPSGVPEGQASLGEIVLRAIGIKL